MKAVNVLPTRARSAELSAESETRRGIPSWDSEAITSTRIVAAGSEKKKELLANDAGPESS